jgi:hypothetical protein
MRELWRSNKGDRRELQAIFGWRKSQLDEAKVTFALLGDYAGEFEGLRVLYFEFLHT